MIGRCTLLSHKYSLSDFLSVMGAVPLARQVISSMVFCATLPVSHQSCMNELVYDWDSLIQNHSMVIMDLCLVL